MFRWLRRKSGSKVVRHVRSRRARLMVQGLESRVVPTTYNVLNADDAGPGSLRQAIEDANAAGGADDIAFNAAFFATPRTITLTAANGQLTIADDLVVNGPGAGLLTVSGGGATRVFNVNNTAAILNVTINGMTITGGNGTNGGATPANGGGINFANENLTLENVVVGDREQYHLRQH